MRRDSLLPSWDRGFTEGISNKEEAFICMPSCGYLHGMTLSCSAFSFPRYSKARERVSLMSLSLGTPLRSEEVMSAGIRADYYLHRRENKLNGRGQMKNVISFVDARTFAQCSLSPSLPPAAHPTKPFPDLHPGVCVCTKVRRRGGRTSSLAFLLTTRYESTLIAGGKGII